MPKELLHKRTEFGKSFDLGEGKERLHLFSKPKHFDKNGAWEEVDLSLNLLLSPKGYSSHYLADKNKWSYGFRNDKKLDKFYGIRRGSTNQLEGTLKRVDFDGSSIPLPDKFVSVDQISPTEISHSINDELSSYTKIDEDGFKNALKTSKWLQTFCVEERLDLKGFTIINSCIEEGGKKEYVPDERGAFNFQADTGDVLSIHPASMWNLLSVCDEGINHRLVEEKGELVYIKTPNKKGEEWLLRSRPPFFIDISVTRSTYYYMQSLSDTTWDYAHSGTQVSSNSGYWEVYVYCQDHGDKTYAWNIEQGFVSYDFSSYAGYEVVLTEAVQLWACIGMNSNGNNLAITKNASGTTPSWDASSSYSALIFPQGTDTWASTSLANMPPVMGSMNMYRFRDYNYDVGNTSPTAGTAVSYTMSSIASYIAVTVSPKNLSNAVFFGFNF